MWGQVGDLGTWQKKKHKIGRETNCPYKNRWYGGGRGWGGVQGRHVLGKEARRHREGPIRTRINPSQCFPVQIHTMGHKGR